MKIKKDEIELESGVSELIGAILLVSLVVMLMMVVTTVIISQPRPEKIPELSVSISNASNNVTITHMGGDTLKWGEFQVIIDGNPVPPLYYHNSAGGLLIETKEDWSFENPTIVIYYQPSLKVVELYYNGPSNKILLAKTNFV